MLGEDRALSLSEGPSKGELLDSRVLCTTYYRGRGTHVSLTEAHEWKVPVVLGSQETGKVQP